MIHEEICTYEVCKLAKEKGFPQDPDKNDHCLMYCWDGLRNIHPLAMWIVWEMEEYDHDNLYAAPTQSLLQRWLREEKGIIAEVFVDDDSNMPLTYNIHQYKDWDWECVCHHHGNYYAVNDWELCLEDALKYALENLLN
jgi:hypothetical protein